VLALAACQHDIADTDGAFYAWNDRPVHCAVDIDTSTRNDWASIETGLDRARDRGEVLELYAHHPGVTVSWDLIDKVLAGAEQRGLPFLTYADLAHGGVTPTGGLVLSFDDEWVDAWFAGRDVFQRHGARVTFFIAYYPHYTDQMKAELHTLAGDGHDVEAHSITHARAPEYVESRGLRAYLDEDVLPSITLLENDGYPVTTFAYPFGSRTGETDHAILEHVTLLRSVAFSWTGVESPCPF
jgi:polysaccharide deacetylase